MHQRSIQDDPPRMHLAIRPRSSAVAVQAPSGTFGLLARVAPRARATPGLASITSPIAGRGLIASRTRGRLRRLIGHLVSVLTACLLVSAVLPGATVLAQGGSSAPPTAVRTGTCAQPGDVVALLEAVPIRRAVAQDVNVSTSVTDVMSPLVDLAAEPHVIVVQLPDGGSELCGSVRGMPVDDGLAIPLVTTDGDIVGISWLRELGRDATTIHVFVVAKPMEPVDITPVPERSAGPTASPSPGATATAEPEAAKDEEIDPREDTDVDVAD